MNLKAFFNKFIASVGGDGMRSLINLQTLLHTSFLHYPVLKKSESANTRKQILLIKLDAIGDFFIWLPTAKKLRDLYEPEKYEIILVAISPLSAVAEHTGYFNKVISLDKGKYKKSFSYRKHILNQIASTDYDSAINCSTSREFAYGDIIISQVKSIRKIGFDKSVAEFELPIWTSISQKWYTNIISIDSSVIHSEFHRNNVLTQYLGVKDNRIVFNKLEFSKRNLPDPIKNILPTDYFVISPGSRVGKKVWASGNYAELAQLVVHKTGYQCVICGSPEEYALGEIIKEESGLPIINLAGRTSLLDLANLIANAKFVIGNDSSAVHIAASVNTTSLCIVGGGQFGRFFPYPTDIEPANIQPNVVYYSMPCYGCNWRCIYSFQYHKVVPCIENITVAMAWEAFCKVM